MDFEITHVDPTKLIVGENVRSESNLDIDTIAHSIEREGIQVPLALRKIGKQFRVMQGHRRLAGVLEVKGRNPDAYKRHHPKGIPCYVRTDIVDDAGEMRVKVDQGTQKSLSLNCELQRAASILLDAGLTEEEVVFQLEGLFRELSRSLPSKTRESIKELRAAAKPDEKKIRKLLLDTYKGKLQALKKVHACPKRVAAALEFAETGVKPKGFKTLPSHIRRKDVKGLLEAFQKDMEIRETDGTPKYSKAEPGPSFGKAWSDLVKHVPQKDEGKRLKAMSAKAMQAQLDDGTYASKGFQKLTAAHSGVEGVEGINAADATLHLVELVQKYAPERWKQFVEAAQEIKQGIADGTLKA